MTRTTHCTPLAIALIPVLIGGIVLADGPSKKDVDRLVRQKCLECHDGKMPSGNVNLGAALATLAQNDENEGASSAVWERVEKAVAGGRMPPEDGPDFDAAQRTVIVDWYRNTFILRDGKEHIGTTPLRRLTRYELQRTLEAVLGIQLRAAYVQSAESDGLQQSTFERLLPEDVLGESGFDNDAIQLASVRFPIVKYVDAVDYALRVLDQNEVARQQVVGLPNAGEDRIREDDAKRILQQFFARATRGRAPPDEWSEVWRAYTEKANGTDGAGALHAGLRMSLLSPSFLYRFETARGQATPYPVSAHELAVRLSYFLWSSMPDDKLRARADDGSLLNEEVLRGELRRMLSSPQRVSLSENFAGQWLGFDDLRRNKVYYRGQRWTRGIYDELLFTFDELIRSNRPILELVDADWAYIRRERRNIPGTKVPAFERHFDDIFASRHSRAGLKVEVFYHPPRLHHIRSDTIGGIVTSTGIMRLTSAPRRTNAIRRGVWVLEKIIGEEMHPPANIPPLADGESAGPPDILRLHSERAACRVCHQHIDPLGLGLENFSPIGEWRDRYEDKSPVEGVGRLPDGQEFSNPKELKQALLRNYKDRIVDNVIRRMLSYAIGRSLQPYDRPTVESIRDALERDNYRMLTLIEQVVLSKPFRFRQDLP